MPIDPEFLQMLVCPRTRKPVRHAEPSELERVNAWIRSGRARNRGGEPVAEPLLEGLVPEGEPVVYPVRDDIPIMLSQEAIPLDPGALG